MPSRGIKREGLPGPWRERLWLDDGRQLVLRPIDHADAEALRHGFELLTAEEVRFRFLHPLRELTPKMAAQLSQPKRKTEFVLVVAEDLPPGDALVGAVARASVDPEGRRAEFAIIVSRLLARQGLGKHLMRRLIRWAKLKRLDSLYGDVLDDNTAMLTLASSLGFRREHRADERGVTRITLDLKTIPAPNTRH